MKIQKRLMTVVAILFFLAALPVSPAVAQMACEALTTLVLPDTTINGAELITSGTFIPPDGTPPITGLPAFCRVWLTVVPQINVEVWLPTNTWNNRFSATGNGGYAGNIPYSGGMSQNLSLGYATAGTDTGHSSSSISGSFALNPDGTLNWTLIEDFAYWSLHEMTVKAKAIIEAFYGEAPKYSYWKNCSTGGRQGLVLAQRFPGDYDGIVAGCPVINMERLYPAELWPQIVMNQEVGQPILASKLATVYYAAYAACDGLDGLVDGVIDDPRRCDFDPRVLQTSSCTSTDPTCLMPAEATAVRKIYEGPRGANGQFLWYGLTPGTDFSGQFSPWRTGLAGPFPFPIDVDYFRYWIERNPAFDWHSLDYASFEQDFRASEQLFHGIIGFDNPNLFGFRDSGAKLIVYHGWVDNVIFPQGTVNYWERVLDTMGGSKRVSEFARLYMVPGMDHCAGGPGPNNFDTMGALINWVENGQAPDSLIASKIQGGQVVRTRPLCPYPLVARYIGTGSIDDAENFTCLEIKPTTVQIRPTTIKLGSTKTFKVSFWLPKGYSGRDWEIISVTCQGIPAMKIRRFLGNSYEAKFEVKDLLNITPGKKITFIVSGIAERNGQQVAFEGSDSVRVIE